MNEQENTIAFLGIWRGQITIPRSSTTPADTALMALLRAGGYNGPAEPLLVSISGSVIAMTARASFLAATPRPSNAIAASDFTTHGYPCDEGVEYVVPSALDASTTYLRASADSDILAQAQVLW